MTGYEHCPPRDGGIFEARTVWNFETTPRAVSSFPNQNLSLVFSRPIPQSGRLTGFVWSGMKPGCGAHSIGGSDIPHIVLNIVSVIHLW